MPDLDWLLFGNCMRIMSRMPDLSVDAIITDPPYDSNGEFMEQFTRICKGRIITFCKPENQFFKPDEYLFWVKTPSTKNYAKSCGRFVEMILVKKGRVSPFHRLHWSQMTGVYDDRLVYPPSHPFEKPLSLMERLVRIYTNPGDVVLDPFMGSGTTGVASVVNGRKFIGMEKDMNYYDIARERIRKYVD